MPTLNKFSPRKVDKLRPYRVDYFDIKEMKDNDVALVRSVVVRAVTAERAENLVQFNYSASVKVGTPDNGRIIIRAYRYYKKLGTRKKDVYKAVEDLFSANKAIEVMEKVELYRDQKQLTDPATNNGHTTRFSDSSLYDEVCTKCGATDTSGQLDQPCPVSALQPITSRQLLAEVRKHPNGSPEQKAAIIEYLKALDAEPTETITENLKALDAEPVELITEVLKALEPTTGPDSLATKTVVADLNGMLTHDAHEQAMDTFVPDNVPEGKTFPDPTNTAPVTPFTPFTSPSASEPSECYCSFAFPPKDEEYKKHLVEFHHQTLIEPDQAVGSAGRPPFPLNAYSVVRSEDIPHFGLKLLLLFGGALTAIIVLLKLLHH
jgi:hypothetical protein